MPPLHINVDDDFDSEFILEVRARELRPGGSLWYKQVGLTAQIKNHARCPMRQGIIVFAPIPVLELRVVVVNHCNFNLIGRHATALRP